jgi:hypothetical protein
MRVETDKFVMKWVIPERVIQINYTGKMQSEDFRRVAQELEAFYAAGTMPIHVVSDTTNMTSIDVDMKTLQKTFSIFTREKWGWVMLIGTNQLLNFFAALLERFLGVQIRRSESAAAALTSLHQLDHTLVEHSEQ